MKIFIDLDDTLADTSAYIEKKFHYKRFLINENPLKKPFFLFLKDVATWFHIRKNENFWQELPIGAHAFDIIEKTKHLSNNIYILSALAQPVYPFKNKCYSLASNAKKKWVLKNYPQFLEKNIIICHAKEKHLQINTDDLYILIDDSLKNIKRWKNSGGIAVHFDNQNPEKTFEQLEFIEKFQNDRNIVGLFNDRFFNTSK